MIGALSLKGVEKMNKAEMKKGMLLKREEESGTCLYRVLELEEERILVMESSGKATL